MPTAKQSAGAAAPVSEANATTGGPALTLRRALISVWDKTGIVDFARALSAEFGVEIISTGGTARTLRDAGIPVTLIESITGFPEMLDGRVKTLHPAVHAGILADRDNPEHMNQLAAAGIKPIDLVVVDLYPFEKTTADPNCTFEHAIEMIDIGGVTLLRAAAKNHKHVLVPPFRDDLPRILNWLREDELSDSGWAMVRRDYATSALRVTADYDAGISAWIGAQDFDDRRPMFVGLRYLNWGPVRYGENAHQSAELFRHWKSSSGLDLTIADAEVDDQENWQHTRISYNNYVDADAALGLCAELTRANPNAPACVFIKHTNPCGVGIAADPVEAHRRAYLGDPNAAMGGILACNFAINAQFAQAVMDSYARWGKDAGAGGFFVEVWIAPEFDDEAHKIVRTAKKWGENVRLFSVGDMNVPPDPSELSYRSISGGMLAQSPDLLGLNEEQWKVVSKRAPSEAELNDLRLAWLICKHTKSNAISIVKDGSLLGNGAGQMSRVMSCRIATWLARENGHEVALPGSVAASDAFFPFPDGPRVLADAGVRALIQPGGSKRDEETIAFCNQRDIAMIMTGTRHFRH